MGLGDLNPVRIVEGKGAIGESGLGGLVIGAGLAAMGIPPGMAALYTGGASALLTGDLKKGLFMGMGAYGGAGLAGGLESLGEGAATQEAQTVAAQNAAQTANEIDMSKALNLDNVASDALTTPDQLQAARGAPTPINAAQTGQTVQTTTPAPGLEGAGQRVSNMGAGIDRLTSSGGIDALSKQMAANAANPAIGGPASLMGAAGFAGAGALGTYKQPSVTAGVAQKPGYIRQFTFDPFGQRYNALTPVQADQWGSRSFQDAFKAADGGIVALANGGAVPGYADGGFTDAQVASYIQNNNLSGEALQNAANVFGVSADQIGRAQSLISANDPGVSAATQAYNAQIAANPALAEQNKAYYDPATNSGTGWEDYAINHWVDTNPNATYQQMREAAASSGITDEDIIRAYGLKGFSAADQNVTLNKDWANAAGQTGYQGLNANINNWLDKYPTATKADALQAMQQSGLNERDVIRATGKTLDELFAEKKQIIKPPVITTPGGTGGIGTLTPTPAPNLTLRGDKVVNPDGSITVGPNLPGAPYKGISDVKNTYTGGGGSLGYVSPVMKSAAEHEAAYNKLTGGSKSAFDYLSGKAPYSAVPYTETGEIMKPYAESVLGVPADNTRFAQRFNPVTRKYEANPDYKPFLFNQDTGQTTRGMNQAELREFVADPKNLVTPSTTSTGWLSSLVEQLKQGLLDRPVWMAQNNVSYEQLAAALGISVADAKKRFPAKEVAATTTTETPTTDAATGGLMGYAAGGLGSLGGYSDGGRLLKGPGDGVSDSIPASIGDRQPARLADGEFVVPARIVSELGNGSTDAGARKLYQMMDRVQKARGKTTGKGKVATNSRADKYLPV